jgi:hypothetical protein
MDADPITSSHVAFETGTRPVPVGGPLLQVPETIPPPRQESVAVRPTHGLAGSFYQSLTHETQQCHGCDRIADGERLRDVTCVGVLDSGEVGKYFGFCEKLSPSNWKVHGMFRGR